MNEKIKNKINFEQHIPFFVVEQTGLVTHISKTFKKNILENNSHKITHLKEIFDSLNLPSNQVQKLLEIKDIIFPYENKYLFLKFPLKNSQYLFIVQKIEKKIIFREEFRKRKALIEIVNNIFQAFSRDVSIDDLLQSVVDVLHQSEFPFYHVGIFLLDDTKEYVYLASLAGENKAYFEKKFPDGYFQKADKGIIGRTIQTGKIQLVPDVSKDPDFENLKELPTVSEICIPIYSNDEVIGAINIESSEYYEPDEWEITLIKNIANYLGLVISNRMLIYELEEKQKEMENYVFEVQEAKERIENQTFEIIETLEQIDEARQLIEKQNQIIQNELKMAGNLQKSLITPKPQIDSIEIASWYEPSENLGGDFYDFKLLDKNKLLFIEVDVTGHGVSSALLAAMSKIAFQNAAGNYQSPGELLAQINREFVNLNQTDMFFSAFVGMLDVESGILEFSNASHPHPILLKKEKEILLDSDGFLIGVMPEMTFENKQIQIEKGDILFIYTDGIIEARNDEDKQFGQERLIQLLKENAELPLQNLLSVIVEKVKDFSSNSLEDDVTLLAFRKL